jgi:hypothetical protein
MTTTPKPMKKAPSVVRLEEMLPVLRDRFGVVTAPTTQVVGIYGF